MYYPALTNDAEFALGVIAEHLAEDPEYLDHEECPYPEHVRALFRRETEEQEEVEELDLERQTTKLFRELDAAKDNFESDDHSERMSYFRTATSLLEKLIGLRERALNLRQVSKFYSIVLEAMEEFLEPAQITQLRDRLKDHVE